MDMDPETGLDIYARWHRLRTSSGRSYLILYFSNTSTQSQRYKSSTREIYEESSCLIWRAPLIPTPMATKSGLHYLLPGRQRLLPRHLHRVRALFWSPSSALVKIWGINFGYSFRQMMLLTSFKVATDWGFTLNLVMISFSRTYYQYKSFQSKIHADSAKMSSQDSGESDLILLTLRLA